MKKKISFLLAVSLLTTLSGCGKTQESPPAAETAPVLQTEAMTETVPPETTETETVPETTETETVPETTETETVPETAETETTAEESDTIQMDGLLSHDGIVQIVTDSFKEREFLSEIRYDDSQQAYIISTWENGFGEICDKFNNFSEGWSDVQNTALQNYSVYYDMFQELDSKSGVILNLVDDRNHDKKILSVQNHQIIYDMMEEKTPDELRQTTADILNQQFAETGKKAQAVYDASEQAYIISVWYDGLGEDIENQAVAPDKWNSQKDIFRVMYDSIRAILQSSGDNTPLIMKVVDERNHENTLVIMKDSEIIYDILAE